MADTTATNEILAWSAEREPWIQDALRRIAESGKLDEADHHIVLANLKYAHGIEIDNEAGPEAEALTPLSADHLADSQGSSLSTVRLEAVKEIRHVGRLAENAELVFETGGLTALYGNNGAGKSAYGKILKKTTHARGIDRRRILPDVFKDHPQQPATAKLKLTGQKNLIEWLDEDGTPPVHGISVFDAHVGGIYVDDGNNIQLLPFNLDVMQNLIKLCDWLRAELSNEIEAKKQALPQLMFPEGATTAAITFWNGIDEDTTEEQIAANCTFSEGDEKELELLKAPQLRLDARAPVSKLFEALDFAEAWFSDDALIKLKSFKQEGEADTQTAEDASNHLTKGHDLPITSPAWAEMFSAAKAYATEINHPFPPNEDEEAKCPLCQQDLDAEAHKRVHDFNEHIEGELRVAALTKVKIYEETLQELREVFQAVNSAWSACLNHAEALLVLEEIQEAIQATVDAIKARAETLSGWLEDKEELPPMLDGISPEVAKFKKSLDEDFKVAQQGQHSEAALKRAQRLLELEHRSTLATVIEEVRKKVTMKQHIAGLNKAWAAANPQTVTSKFNALKDTYMTAPVMAAYEQEFKALNLDRLQVQVGKIKSREGAKFGLSLKGQKVDASLANILSEGERRALSLAAFLAEQDVGGGSGCLIFDDPMSSLDHHWTNVVAKRLVEEAQKRQIIVFTHDLVFFNDMEIHAEQAGLEFHPQSLFQVGDIAGKVDPAGVPFDKRTVATRIQNLESMLAKAIKAEQESPAEFSVKAKEFLGNLRDTWERLIEENLFNKVVVRQRSLLNEKRLRNVSFPEHMPERIKECINEISEIGSHDKAQAKAPDITSKLLKELLDKIVSVRTEIEAHQKSTQK